MLMLERKEIWNQWAPNLKKLQQNILEIYKIENSVQPSVSYEKN